MELVTEIESAFPGMQGDAYEVTSPRTERYNCIAWAAGDTTTWWWPDDPKGFWPEGVPGEQTIDAFSLAFATLGYGSCNSEMQETGHDKIALFADDDHVPTHAARQLPNGRWTSKLGILEDIEHDLHDLEGEAYGKVVVIMKRPIPADGI